MSTFTNTLFISKIALVNISHSELTWTAVFYLLILILEQT